MKRSPTHRERLARWDRRRATLALLGLLLFLAACAAAWLFLKEAGLLPQLAAAGQQVQYWLQQIPVPLYLLAFCILPALGFPLSPFYLTIAAVLGGIPEGIAAALVCLGLNSALSYWLTISVARRQVERLLERRGIRLPKITPQNQRMVTIMLRASPLPYIIQNFVLALGGVAFSLYIVCSILIQGMIACGMIIVGGSLFEGNGRWALIGVFLLMSTTIIISRWRQKQQSKHRHELGTRAD